MNRALRAATMGVLLLSPVALSACSAGQVTQTAGQMRDKVGGMAEVGELSLRAVELAYPRGGTYEQGDDAELRLSIANGGTEDDTLVGIDGAFGDVEIDDESATPTGDRETTEIEIPAGGVVHVDGEELTISLTDLDEDLTTGQTLELVFTFENAGEVTVMTTVSTPDNDIPRGESFDFHHEEGGEEAAEGTE